MKKYLFGAVVVLMVVGCTQKVSLVTPGYYQQGRYIDAKYQPAYYDAYGNLHTEQEILPSYQPGRLVRPQLSGQATTKTYSQHVTTQAMSRRMWMDDVSDESLAMAVGQAGLPLVK